MKPLMLVAASTVTAYDTITFDLPANTTISPVALAFMTNTVTIDGSTAAGLTLRDVDISIGTGAVVTLTHLNLTHGGYYGIIHNQGTLALLNSTVSDSFSLGGAAAIINEALLRISNSTISHNGSQGGVAGIFNSGTLTLTNSTLSENRAVYSEGSNLYNAGTLYWYNTILANRPYPSDEDCLNTGVIAVSVNNLVEDGTCSPTFSGDPLLGPLQYHGGRTPTHVLMPGSLAIDAGDPTICLPADQRDYPRPQDGDNNGTAVCDIGSFEAYWPYPFYLPFMVRN